MTLLIAIFLVLLMVLTGTFLSVLGVIGWVMLFVLGAAIVYLGAIAPFRKRFVKSDDDRSAEKRAELGYGAGAVETPEQRHRAELGYGKVEREI
jgi:uncharacterized SAM-binding protein YcdF (DUF218 family)